MSDSENRWMPPSPHREKILEEIANGAAHIVDRGHGVPPLLVFEDGGMIELPRVRLQNTRRGMQLTATEDAASRGETHFYDVCGTIDEILGQVQDGRELDLGEMSALVKDIRYMLERMTRRGAQYAAFFDDIRNAFDTLEALERPEWASADGRLEALHASLRALRESPLSDRTAVTVSAESVRALAQASEDYLAACRRAAMRIGALFDEIKGGRNWAPEDGAFSRADRPNGVTDNAVGSAEGRDPVSGGSEPCQGT